MARSVTGTQTTTDSAPRAIQIRSKYSERQPTAALQPHATFLHIRPRGEVFAPMRHEVSRQVSDPRCHTHSGRVQDYLLTHNANKYLAAQTATASASGANTEHEQDENEDAWPAEIWPTFDCEFQVETDRQMTSQLFSLFDEAKRSGHVVEVGSHEICTKWKTSASSHEICTKWKTSASSLRSSGKRVRSWVAAVRCLAQCPLCNAFARVWTKTPSQAGVKR